MLMKTKDDLKHRQYEYEIINEEKIWLENLQEAFKNTEEDVTILNK